MEVEEERDRVAYIYIYKWPFDDLDAMSHQHYRSPFGDTTMTKVFVGGLAWETLADAMREYFEQFGEILEAVVITDKSTGKSKGYGFVTYRDAESARRACADPNPVIDGRRANCNIASLGQTRPSAPRARGAAPQGASSSPSYRLPPLLPPPLLQPPPPPPPPVIYPPYGYPSYSPDYRYPQQAFYNHQLQQPQYYHQQLYGRPSSPSPGSPYFHGYSNPHASRGTTISTYQAQHIQGPSYPYYPTPMERYFSTYPSPPLPLLVPPPPPPSSQPITAARHPGPSSTDSHSPNPQQTSAAAAEEES